MGPRNLRLRSLMLYALRVLVLSGYVCPMGTLPHNFSQITNAELPTQNVRDQKVV